MCRGIRVRCLRGDDSGFTGSGHPIGTRATELFHFDASGTGFLVGRSNVGELRIGGYALVRFINQRGDEEFTDHLGNVRPVDLRRDIQFHRAMLHFRGWLLSEKSATRSRPGP